ncbi:MAG: phosphopantetheine-binding protein [Bacteroidota bacterium]|jgi:acyl carrier protein
MSVIDKFRELLLPVLGFESIDELPPDAALVKDLGADSLDFVEIMYIIESNFGVVLKTSQIIAGGENIRQEDIFEDNRLTAMGLQRIEQSFPGSAGRFTVGMNRVDVFSTITIRDIAGIIDTKLLEGNKNA